MKIEIQYPEKTLIAKFADKHKLVMQVHEREMDKGLFGERLPRFYANFRNAETKSSYILSGPFGNGETVSEAIANYAKDISGKLLVINSTEKKKRKEIRVPNLIHRKGK